MDFLVDDTGKVAEIKDKAMLVRLTDIEQLDQDDQKTIIHVLDSLIRDAKARKTASTATMHRARSTHCRRR